MRTIKGKVFWAKESIRTWIYPSDTRPTEAECMEQAYLAGFDKMRDMAAGLVTELGPNQGLAILIRAIGTAEVDLGTGKKVGE